MQVRLSTPNTPPIAEVGGKAASLIRLGHDGFNVPDGIVLTTAFFAPWIEHIAASDAWQSVIATISASRTRLPGLDERERLAHACDDVKRLASGLPFDVDQRKALDNAHAEFENGTLAVRSSSPEEA